MPRWVPSFALLALLAGACSSPCDRLLAKVCGCPGERAQAACDEAKRRYEARDKAVRDQDKCRKELEKFRCEQLR